MSALKHEYPSKYGKGQHWALDKAWEILDTMNPGELDVSERAYLAGMITGALSAQVEVMRAKCERIARARGSGVAMEIADAIADLKINPGG